MTKPRAKSVASPKAPARHKLTPQQENFARHVVRGHSQAEAYRRSYVIQPDTLDTSIHVNACKLAAKPNVAQRIDELRAKAAERAMVTRENMLVEMGFNHERAVDKGAVSAANTASRDRARLAGHLQPVRDPPKPPGAAGEAADHVDAELTIEDRSLNEIARRIAFTLTIARRAKTANN